jgi:hypothetical protein
MDRGDAMKYDMVKVDEALLAVLGVFEFQDRCVWKRYDFAAMDGLQFLSS